MLLESPGRATGRLGQKGTEIMKVGLEKWVCILAIALCALRAAAADKYWQPASGDWADGANWAPAGMPTSVDTAYIDNGGTATITTDVEADNAHVGYSAKGTVAQTGGILSVDSSLYLGRNFGSTGIYELQAGELTVTDFEYVGYSGKGTFTQTGGTHRLENFKLYLGYNSGSTGVYTLQAGELAVGQSEYVGYSGAGTFTQTGGTHSVGNSLRVTSRSTYSSASVYRLQDGELVAGWENVGGTFIQSGGTHSISGNLEVACSDPSAKALYSLQDGELTVAGGEYVGYSGTFTQTGGTHGAGYLHIRELGRYKLAGGRLEIADGLKLVSSGAFDCSGGTAHIQASDSSIVDFSQGALLGAASASLSVGANSLTIFPAGSDPQSVFGSYTTQGMTHVAGSTLTVSAGEGFAGMGEIVDFVDCQGVVGDPASDIDLLGGVFVSRTGAVRLGGTLRVDSSGSGISGGSLTTLRGYIGNSGMGSFAQTGGTHSVSDVLYIGRSSGSTGVYTLEDGELTVAEDEFVGLSGTGTFIQTGGTHSIGGDLKVTFGSTSTSVYTLEDGELTVGEDEHVGSSGTGTFTQTGGRHNVGGNFQIGYGSGSGIYELLDGELTVAGRELMGNYGTGTGSFTQTGGTHSAGHLLVGKLGRYELGDGTLAIEDGLKVEPGGVFDCAGGTAAIHVSDWSMVDFSQGDLLSAESASLCVGANSLTIFPAGSDPQSIFGSYATQGMTLLAGAALTVSEGEGFAGVGDLTGFLDCQGIVGSPDSSIDLWGGVFVSGPGQVNLGGGTLQVDSPGSGMSGGSLTTLVGYVGFDGSGAFVQTGGTHRVNWIVPDQDGGVLWLGYESGSTGIYELQAGELTVANGEYVGFSGKGTFTQTGGTHSVGGLYLGAGSGSTGIYDLQAGELTVGWSESVGSSGKGTFTQTGGTHSVGHNLYLGAGSGSTGVYELHDGLLDVGGTVQTGTGTGVLVVRSPADASFGALNLTSGTARLEMQVTREANALVSVSGTALLGGELFLNTGGGVRPLEGQTFTIMTAGGSFVGDFAEVGSDVTLGIPEGLEAFSTVINGTAYEVTFNGYTSGDANGDHAVDVGDLGILAGNWNQSGKAWAQGDFTGEGDVNIGDLGVLAGNWGWRSPAGQASVPEPGCLSVLALGSLVLIRRRRK